MGIRSIRIRILAIVFISLVPVLLLLLYKASEQRAQEITAIQAESLNSAKLISREIEREIKEGRVTAGVALSIDPNRFNEKIANLQKTEGTSFFAVDRSGTIIARYPDPGKWVGKNMLDSGIIKVILTQEEGTVESRGLAGNKRIFSFTPVRGTDKGIYVCLGISSDMAFAKVNRKLLRDIILLTLTGFAASLIAWFGSDFFIMRRMGGLAAATDELANGNLGVRAAISDRNDEIDQFAMSFNKMAAALEKHSTEQKIAEEKLKISYKQLEDVIEFLPDATLIIDKNRNVIAWNRAIEEMTGIQKADIIGKHYSNSAVAFYGEQRPFLVDLVLQNDKELVAKYEYVEQKGSVLFAEVFASRLYNGKGAYIWITVSPLLNPDGNIIGGIESIRDITEHIETENELKKLGYQKDLILRSSGEGILGLDLNGNHTFVNPSAARMLGYGEEELIGRRSHSTWHHTKKDGSRYAEEECPIYKTFKDGKFHRNKNEVFWRKDGSSFPVSYMSSPILEQGKIIGAVVTFRDITERKQAEEAHEKLEHQLRQAQKMEVVGQLAGGIAHDFNNIVSAMMGFASLCQIEMKEYEPAHKYVANILTLSERAANLTKSLLTFGRKQVIDLRHISLSDSIKTVLRFLKRIIGENIKLDSNIADENLVVIADSGQLEQVLMNLAANARDAMPNGGTISINTQEVEIDREFIEIHGYGKEGRYGLITVADTGIGMDAQTTERIFEPFFTTKEVGKGSGLGLAMVYGIIKQHDGFLQVESAPGAGSKFKIYLPAVRAKAEHKTYVEPVPPTGGSETILLAEDDEALTRALRMALQGFGYTVIEAADGEEAVARFKENKDKIKLFISDVIMPNKNGIEAFREILAIKPDIKALFMSGYAPDVLGKGFPDAEFKFMAKPLPPSELLKRVRETLDQK
ncbi:MAG: PAS domain S-box protein [Nitrospirae bacterium]|nr:PAS domain S-box protein [Nitrospirota bacterium]